MEDEWKAAIDHLYEVFACYRRPTTLEAAPTRDPVAILRRLTSAPLRELPAEALGTYAGQAMTTVGSESEYRHFLPRIVELSIAIQGSTGLEPEQIAGKLEYGRWRTWPEDAQTAIVRAFTAAWHKTRVQTPDLGDASSQLCALAILGIDIAPFLAIWASPASAVEVRQMAAHVQAAAGLADPVYWKNAGEANCRALLNWAHSPALREAIEAQVSLVAYADLWEIDRAFTELETATRP